MTPEWLVLVNGEKKARCQKPAPALKVACEHYTRDLEVEVVGPNGERSEIVDSDGRIYPADEDKIYPNRPHWLRPPILGVHDPLDTGIHGKNADAVQTVAIHYWPDPGARVLDATWGKGNFWKPRLLQSYEVTANDWDTTKFADHTYDFRSFPEYWAEHFEAVLLDPDYTVKGTREGHGLEDMNDAFGLTHSVSDPYEMLEINLAGVTEAHRVLKPGGTLAMKYGDQVSSGAHVDACWRIGEHARKLGFVELRRLYVIRARSMAQPARMADSDHFTLATQQNPAQNVTELIVYEKEAA